MNKLEQAILKTSENGGDRTTNALAVVTLLPDHNNEQPITLGETEMQVTTIVSFAL